MENENLEQEESILTLTDENGQDMDLSIWTACPTRARNIWC